MKYAKHDATMRFTLPVIAENTFTTAVGLVYSALVGGISVSSLSAAGSANQMMNLLVAAFSLVTTGCAILTARYTGHGDIDKAARVVEQVGFFAPVTALIVAVCLFLSASPLMGLLMPGADADLYREGTRYFRVVVLSLPALIAMNAMSGALRAAGESRQSLLCALITNAAQLISAYLFVSVMRLEVVGAAYAYVVCRYIGVLSLYIAAFSRNRRFHARARNLLKPDVREFAHVARVGMPSSVDAIAVQSGYIVINAILIRLGSGIINVYNVLNALTALIGVPQSVCNANVITLVGQKVGAGDLSGARRTMMRIMLYSMLATLVLSFIMCVFPTFFAGLFTKDASVCARAAGLMWLLAVYCLPAVGVNAAEPAARVGGESRFVMLSAAFSVWFVRLPLTYALCYGLGLGVTGVFIANAVSLSLRTVLSLRRVFGARWGRREL